MLKGQLLAAPAGRGGESPGGSSGKAMGLGTLPRAGHRSCGRPVPQLVLLWQ